jgi:hypothetical protein
MRELQSRGVQVPRDVAVAGFDNVPLCGLLQPPLTSVDVRGGQQGESMIAELHGLIARERQPSVVLIEPRLVEAGIHAQVECASSLGSSRPPRRIERGSRQHTWPASCGPWRQRSRLLARPLTRASGSAGEAAWSSASAGLEDPPLEPF